MTSQYEGASSSRHYEKEAEETRRRLAENLDELSERLTPGQVVDEVLTYSRVGGSSFMRAFGDAVRENPIPSLLIGAGCMLFVSEKVGGRFLPWSDGGGRPNRYDEEDAATGYPSTSGDMSRSSGRTGSMADGASSVAERVGESAQKMTSGAAGSTGSAARSAADSIQSGARAAAEAARQAAASVTGTVAAATDAVRATSQGLSDQATGAARRLAHGAQDAVGAVRDYSSSYGGRISETADRTRRQARDVARHSKETAASFISEQPLLCAAIGVAVGAAIATMLPPTETEDEWIGEASDAVKGAAGGFEAESFGNAKDAAGQAADRVEDAVKEGDSGAAQERPAA